MNPSALVTRLCLVTHICCGSAAGEADQRAFGSSVPARVCAFPGRAWERGMERKWNAMERNGTEWNGMERNGTQWNAMERNGTEWNAFPNRSF